MPFFWLIKMITLFHSLLGLQNTILRGSMHLLKYSCQATKEVKLPGFTASGVKTHSHTNQGHRNMPT